MRKLLILCFVFCLFGCGTQPSTGLHEKADFSGYELFQETDHVFLNSDVEDLIKQADEKKTFVVYFGFATCPWCNEAVPVLNRVAKQYNQSVYYVDTRKDPNAKKNSDIKDYDLLVERFGEFLGTNAEGNPYLYVPLVFFIHEGRVILAHEGTTPDHDAHERLMTEEEVQELTDIYTQGFELIK